MKQVVIAAPPAVAQRLADRLHSYFIVSRVPMADGTNPHIDIVYYTDDNRKIQETACNFSATENMKWIMTMFWIGYRRLFPHEPTRSTSW